MKGMAPMNLCNATLDQLKAELVRRRQQGNLRANPPAPEARPNFSKVRKQCASYIEAVAKGELADSGATVYIFEEAIEACYGREVWKWIRALT